MKSRTINLLHRLLHSKIPLTIKYLATEFEVSERTIRNDISEINELLNEKNLKPVTFKRSKGVILNLTDDEQQRLFEENIEERYLNREERIRDLILDIAFGNDPVFLNKKRDTVSSFEVYY
ncbi:HTH domain-containing protein [Streptococcus uberis]|nr:HTH domain-containing protein [Streptococcus uberis]MCK1198874.1 HTH domain-containing protein [Streptococcus uberis]